MQIVEVRARNKIFRKVIFWKIDDGLKYENDTLSWTIYTDVFLMRFHLEMAAKVKTRLKIASVNKLHDFSKGHANLRPVQTMLQPVANLINILRS